MKITPLFDRVVLKQMEAKEKTASGIVLPTAAQERPQMGVVIAAGPGGNIDGKEVEMKVKEGDVVLYSKYSGAEYKIDDEICTIIRQTEILAIVEKE